MWGNVWWLTKKELRKSSLGLIITILMTGYLGFFSTYTFDNIADGLNERNPVWESAPVDIIFLACMGSLGFCMTKDYFSYWSKNTFTWSLE